MGKLKDYILYGLVGVSLGLNFYLLKTRVSKKEFEEGVNRVETRVVRIEKDVDEIKGKYKTLDSLLRQEIKEREKEDERLRKEIERKKLYLEAFATRRVYEALEDVRKKIDSLNKENIRRSNENRRYLQFLHNYLFKRK